jgi:hypothetical protein
VKFAHLSLVSLSGITPGSQVRGKELLLGRLLCDDVVHRSLLGSWRHGVDGTECQSKQATSVTLSKLLGKLLRQLYGLTFDFETT